jgi:hypothetical protein
MEPVELLLLWIWVYAMNEEWTGLWLRVPSVASLLATTLWQGNRDKNHKHINLLSLFHTNSILFKVNVRGIGVYCYFQQLLAMSWLEDFIWEDNPVSYNELNGEKPAMVRYLETLSLQVDIVTWRFTKPLSVYWYVLPDIWFLISKLDITDSDALHGLACFINAV